MPAVPALLSCGGEAPGALRGTERMVDLRRQNGCRTQFQLMCKLTLTGSGICALVNQPQLCRNAPAWQLCMGPRRLAPRGLGSGHVEREDEREGIYNDCSTARGRRRVVLPDCAGHGGARGAK